MAYVDGKIVFAKLKGFPTLNDSSKVQTQSFLDGAKEVVSLIGKSFWCSVSVWNVCEAVTNEIFFFLKILEEFGNLFMPVVYDMNGNIEVKLHQLIG